MLRGGRRRNSGRELRQHLSERVPTAAGHMLTFIPKQYGCVRSSDSSAQVLCDSRPEFRLLAPRNIYIGFLRFLNLRFVYK